MEDPTPQNPAPRSVLFGFIQLVKGIRLLRHAVLDEQSNRSLCKTELFEHFKIKGQESSYTLKTCSGVVETTGCSADNFIVESIDGNTQISLPVLIECDMLPDDRTEIPLPEVASYYPHLNHLADKIPTVDPDVSILLLRGRDLIQVHKVREQCNGPHNIPFAQRLDLGWVIVGDVCLGRTHKPANVSVFRTSVLVSGRRSILAPCTSNIVMKEKIVTPVVPHISSSFTQTASFNHNVTSMDKDIFHITSYDDKLGMSIEDELFLELMNKEAYMDDANCWVAPLPFKPNRPCIPNNRQQAVDSLTSLCRMLEKKKDMREYFFKFMQSMFDSDQAEPAPELPEQQERWYLPIFGVYH